MEIVGRSENAKKHPKAANEADAKKHPEAANEEDAQKHPDAANASVFLVICTVGYVTMPQCACGLAATETYMYI